MSVPQTGSGAAPTSAARLPGGRPPFWVRAATILLALLLMETAAETVWSGSPIRWWTLGAVVGWAVVMVPVTLLAGWGVRLWMTTLALMVIVVFAVWRLGANADPGLTTLTLPLARLVPLLATLAVVLAAVLVVEVGFVRRRPWLTIAAILASMYCLVPLAFGVVYGTPLEATVRGAGLWGTPPLWLQGGYVALQVIVPLGLLVSVLRWLWSSASRERRPSAVFPGVSAVVLAAVSSVAAIELTRAGISNIAARLMAVPGVSATGGKGPATAALPAGSGEPGNPPGSGMLAPGSTASTEAVELSVVNVELMPALAGRTAAPGQSFVVVRTVWKLPHSAGGAEEKGAEFRPYVVSPLARHLWLLVDSRYAEPIDEAVTGALNDHLPIDVLTVGQAGQAVAGTVVFRTAANASYLALLLLDARHGNALVAVKGRPADAPPAPTLGSSKQNESVALVATEAAWSDGAPAPPPGARYYTLGIRGTAVSSGDLQTLDLNSCGFLQTDQGFVAEPEQANWLRRPFGKVAQFLPGVPNEGQLAFLLPADTQKIRFLLRPRAGGAIDLPVADDFAPAWPQPIGSISDGTTLRLLRLPPPQLPSDLPAPPSGHRYLAIDVLIENLKPAEEIEFQIGRQLRVIDPSGVVYPASPESRQLSGRPTGRAVIPAASARRFQQLFVVPANEPLRLEYRGFERSETVDLGQPPSPR